MQQRVLCGLSVDGKAINLTLPRPVPNDFTTIEAETMDLKELPVQLIETAQAQTNVLRVRTQKAVELVLINRPPAARELWWNLAATLKEPLLTLSLLPDDICGPDNGRASFKQLRKWQLQQLGCIIQDVDDASCGEDIVQLSEALESRVLPWLNSLLESLILWRETTLSGSAQPSVPVRTRH